MMPFKGCRFLWDMHGLNWRCRLGLHGAAVPQGGYDCHDAGEDKEDPVKQWVSMIYRINIPFQLLKAPYPL